MLGRKKTGMNKNLTFCHKKSLFNVKKQLRGNVVNSIKVIPNVLLEQKEKSSYLHLEVPESVTEKMHCLGQAFKLWLEKTSRQGRGVVGI